jgi:hypothetical protein
MQHTALVMFEYMFMGLLALCHLYNRLYPIFWNHSEKSHSAVCCKVISIVVVDFYSLQAEVLMPIDFQASVPCQHGSRTHNCYFIFANVKK